MAINDRTLVALLKLHPPNHVTASKAAERLEALLSKVERINSTAQKLTSYIANNQCYNDDHYNYVEVDENLDELLNDLTNLTQDQ